MKRRLTALLCAFVAIVLTGCGSSREPLSNAGVKKAMEKNDYTLTCFTGNEIAMCGFSASDKSHVIIYSDESKLAYMADASLYTIDSDKVMEGEAKKEDLKKEYEKILETTDVTTEELTKFMKTEFNKYKEKIAAEKEAIAKKVFKVGERVVVSENGIDYFAFTVNSVTATAERNQFSDKTPTQVVVINYSYENLGMDEDLYISSGSFNVIDADGNVATTYPAGSNIYPQSCPKGAKSDGEQSYGLKSSGNTIKLRLEEYLPGSYEKALRNFELSF